MRCRFGMGSAVVSNAACAAPGGPVEPNAVFVVTHGFGIDAVCFLVILDPMRPRMLKG